MLVTLDGIVIDVKEVQYWKQSIFVTPDGIVIDVKEVQYWKALKPKLVTLDGIVMDVKEVQLAKAPPLIIVTLDGIVMDVKELHPWKVELPILITLDGLSNVTFVKLAQFWNAPSRIAVISLPIASSTGEPSADGVNPVITVPSWVYDILYT